MSGLKSLEPGEELDRMEKRIRSNEAKALAEQDMASDSMSAQFAELDGGLEVEEGDPGLGILGRLGGHGELPGGVHAGGAGSDRDLQRGGRIDRLHGRLAGAYRGDGGVELEVEVIADLYLHAVRGAEPHADTG